MEHKFKLFKSRNQYSDYHLKWQYVKDSFMAAWETVYERYHCSQLNFPRENLVTPDAKLEYLSMHIYGKDLTKKNIFFFDFCRCINHYFKMDGVNRTLISQIFNNKKASIGDFWKALDKVDLEDKYAEEYIKVSWAP